MTAPKATKRAGPNCGSHNASATWVCAAHTPLTRVCFFRPRTYHPQVSVPNDSEEQQKKGPLTQLYDKL